MTTKFMSSWVRYLASTLLLPSFLVGGLVFSNRIEKAEAQSNAGRALTLRSDVQEANAKTGVVTARGNVQINYPARQIQATAAQAQYFSRERRIVLTGNVYVLQQGNSLRGEVITYLIDEGRFVAMPESNQQVESTYIVTDPEPTTAATPPGPPPFNSSGSGESVPTEVPGANPSRSTQP